MPRRPPLSAPPPPRPAVKSLAHPDPVGFSCPASRRLAPRCRHAPPRRALLLRRNSRFRARSLGNPPHTALAQVAAAAPLRPCLASVARYRAAVTPAAAQPAPLRNTALAQLVATARPQDNKKAPSFGGKAINLYFCLPLSKFKLAKGSQVRFDKAIGD